MRRVKRRRWQSDGHEFSLATIRETDWLVFYLVKKKVRLGKKKKETGGDLEKMKVCCAFR